jgi:hypothetical protein
MKKIAGIMFFVFAIIVCAPCFSQVAPLSEAKDSTIGYKSVAEALADLQSKPNVQISVQHGWTIVSDKAAKTIWSFAPKDDPSYPSAVKRTVEEHDGTVFVNMGVLCQASKSACDQLVMQFQQLNEHLSQSMQNRPN